MNSDVYFDEASASNAISRMSDASENLSGNASSFKTQLANMNSALNGAIADKWVTSSTEHASNLENQANNLNNLANDSSTIKSLFAELVERIKSLRG